MQEILQRFQGIEHKARDPYAVLNAVRQDNRILFREGKHSQFGLGVTLVGALAGGIALLAGPLLTPTVPNAPWILFFILLGIGCYLLFRVLARQSRRIRFEIDTVAEKLIVYPFSPRLHRSNEGPQRVALSDIDYFFVRYNEDNDHSLSGALHYVLSDGRAGLLDGGLGNTGQSAENNAKILGHLCARPAYKVRHDTDEKDLVVNYRTPWRNTDTWWNIDRIARDVVLGVSDVLYDPQNPPADISKLTVTTSQLIFSGLATTGIVIGGFFFLMFVAVAVASIWF